MNQTKRPSRRSVQKKSSYEKLDHRRSVVIARLRGGREFVVAFDVLHFVGEAIAEGFNSAGSRREAFARVVPIHDKAIPERKAVLHSADRATA